MGAPSASTPPAPLPPFQLRRLDRVLETSVHSLALSEGGRVAALGEAAWLATGGAWRRLPPPPASGPDVRIYFGRDEQPRLMGKRGAVGVYARLRGGGWERGAQEIGRLGGSPMAPLYGALGERDPEVVCAVDRECLIKRRSGWTVVAAPPGPLRAELCGTTAWAWDRGGVHLLDGGAWRALDVRAEFSRAEHLWAVSRRDVWLVERSPSRLHHFDGERWTAQDSPVPGPRALWASGPADVWLVGDGGAARFDGERWRPVQGLDAPLATVTSLTGAVLWWAGPSGVWRGER